VLNQLFNQPCDPADGVPLRRKITLDRLAESKEEVLARVRERAASYDASRLQRAARDHGNVRTKKFFAQTLAAMEAPILKRNTSAI